MQRGFMIRLIILNCLFVLNGIQGLMAQSNANPFDLQHRLPKEEEKKSSEKESNQNPFDIESSKTTEYPEIKKEILPIKSENPFDIQKTSTQKTVSEKKISAPSPISKVSENEIKDTKSGFLFWMILAMMIFLALLITLYRSLIVKIYRAFSNENILKLLQREQSGIVYIPYLFLYILFLMSTGIFSFQIAHYKGFISFEFKNLIYCIIGVASFFILKYLLLGILHLIFPISKEVKQYSFTITIFSIILGIILIPFNVFIAFAQSEMTKFGIICAIVAIACVYLFRILRGIFIASKFLAFHKFHFFMYICTVEIAPMVILVKLLMNGVSVH